MSFFKKDKSRIVSVIMAVAIIVLAVVVLNIFSKQKSVRNENERLSKIVEISTQRLEREAEKRNREFYEKEIAMYARKFLNRQEDLELIREGGYKASVIPTQDSFSDICDWADYYLGLGTVKPRVCYTTPEEMKEYLSAALERVNPAEKIYLQIDPVELERQYFESHRFDADSIPTFLQIMNECLWSYLSLYTTTDFRIYLPTVSIEKWASYTSEELEEIKSKYNQFVFYTSRFYNKELIWPVNKEYFVANPGAYECDTVLSQDALQRMFLLNESSDKFDFTYNEFDAVWEELLGYIEDYRNGKYTTCNLQDTDVVLIGENLFEACSYEAFGVAGVIKAFTGANVYNISKSTDCSNALLSKADEVSQLNLISSNRVFVINYGLSDYLGGAKLGSADGSGDTGAFLGALSAGISNLKKKFPDARIILVSPYRINGYQNGIKAIAQDGLTLQEIAWNEDTIALNENIEYINLFETLDMSVNTDELYADTFFLDDAGRYLVGKAIADYLQYR